MTDLAFLGSQLPHTWDEVTIEDVTSKVGSGATPRGGSAVYVDSGTAFIRSQNVYDHEFRVDGLVFISDEAANQLRGVTVEPDDVLLNITGDSILRTCVVPREALPARVSQHVAIVRSNGRADPTFLQKLLSLPTMKDYMLGHSSGGTRKAITKGHILSFPIPLPPLEEQRTISAMFAALDNKIESNRRAGEYIWRLLAAEWEQLTDIAPVRPLGDELGLAYGKSLPAETRVRGDVPVYGSNGITGWHVEALVDGPAVIVGRKGSIGEVHWSSAGVYPIDTTFYVQPKDGYPLLACYFALKAAGLQEMNSDSAIPGLNRDRALLVEAQLPERELASAWAEGCETLLLRANALDDEVSTLIALRDALLPELLSGRIRVAGAKASGVAS
jgi:type I restriction enzyme S subunit